MMNKFDIKRLRKPEKFLEWFFHYKNYGKISLIQRILLDKALVGVNMVNINVNGTRYLKDKVFFKQKQSF